MGALAIANYASIYKRPGKRKSPLKAGILQAAALSGAARFYSLAPARDAIIPGRAKRA